jgi:hypothetical protein
MVVIMGHRERGRRTVLCLPSRLIHALTGPAVIRHSLGSRSRHGSLACFALAASWSILLYLDKPVNGTMAAYEDGFGALELSRKYYREANLDLGQLDSRIR